MFTSVNCHPMFYEGRARSDLRYVEFKGSSNCFFKPYITLCKGIQTILDSVILDPKGSMSVELGLRFSIVGGFPDSLSCIPDFKSQNSGLQSKISRIFIDI